MIDNELKELKYKGIPLYYKVEYQYCEYGHYHTTYFYLTNHISRFRKKYFFGLLGGVLEIPDNELIFTFYDDFECCHRTKEENRAFLDRKFELRGRCEEIRNGGLI